jgi:hypothetical protein
MGEAISSELSDRDIPTWSIRATLRFFVAGWWSDSAPWSFALIRSRVLT